MKRSEATRLAVCAIAIVLAGSAAARAQHVDVLVQQVDGQLVSGSANFDTNRWTLGRRVYSGEFDGDYAVNAPGFNALPAGSPSLPVGSQSLPGDLPLGWDFLSMTIEQQRANLFYWNGLDSDGRPGMAPDDVVFGALPGPEYALSLFDQSGAKFTVDGADEEAPGGVIDDTSADGSLHRHRFYLLEDGDATSATLPADGIYLFALRLRMTGLEESKSLFMVFGTLGSSVAALDSAAVPWVEQRVDELVPTQLPGDYNADGAVDAADYVVWRHSLGQVGMGLPADGNRNHEVDSDDYTIWRANFGAVNTKASAAISVVPEPHMCLPLAIEVAAVAMMFGRRRYAPKSRSAYY